MSETVTPEMLLNAYRQGYFPMAQAEDDPELYWFNPEERGILPMESELPLSRSHQRLFRNHNYTLTLNKDFRGVMEQCRRDRDGCWISDRIIDLYSKVHERGFALSLECWQGEQLVGGIYGIRLGGAFFGESMFSRVSGASTVALATLHQTLRRAGYVLFDAQYVNDHLTQFGVQAISQQDYLQRLGAALEVMPHKLDIGV